MSTYIIRRLLFMIPVILGVATIVFLVMRIIPGDIAVVMLGENIEEKTLQALREQLGLTKPLPLQYLEWLGNALRGDFGLSYLHPKEKVMDMVIHALPVTFELTVLATFIAVVIGLPVGGISALRQNSITDQFVRLVAVAGLAAPSFWIGTMAVVLPAVFLSYAPPPNLEPLFQNPLQNLEKMLPAAVILGYALSATIMRMARTTMLEVLRQDYIRTALAKGLTEQIVIRRHALKNALIPVTTIIGLDFARLLGGTVILETIYNMPGIGLLFIESLRGRDYPVVQGVIIFIATVLVFSNLIVDLIYGLLDPRIRYS